MGRAGRALRQATADGLRLHGRLLRHRVHGFENLRRRAGTGKVTNVAFFPKPAAGSWTENWPELGTAPVNYEDSIDPEHFKLEQQAIFKKTWLNVGRVERLPKKGSYFTREMPSVGPGTSVIIVKDKEDVVRAFYNMCRHRGNKLVWNDYPGEEVSGTCRQFTCKYHAWRYALDGDLTFVQQEGEFFDLDKAQLRAGAGALRGLGRLHLHQLRRRRGAADRVPGRLRQGPRGLPVPRDDRALQLPLGDQRQLEAVHRRVHRVLPRADPAHEAGGEGGGREAGQVRLRGAGLRHQGRPLHGVVVGRHVAAEGPQHGQAHRADPAQRPVRAVGPPGHQGHPARRTAAGHQPGSPQDLGHRLVRVLPELHAAVLGAGLVSDLPLLADRGGHAHLRGRPLLRAAEEPPSSACPRSWPR